MSYIFTKHAINTYAPDASGIYFLFDFNGELTYIGQSGQSVKLRLLQHESGSMGTCTQSAYWFACVETSQPKVEEKRQLELFKEEVGRLPRCNEIMP